MSRKLLNKQTAINERQTRPLTTIQPVRRNMITLNMLIMHDVNTPSQVPNNTGSEMKKLAFHHGLLSDDYTTPSSHVRNYKI